MTPCTALLAGRQQRRLGIQQTGAFRFYINIEALTESVQNAPRHLPLAPSPRKKAATR